MNDIIVLMTRYPEAGKAKTRLIPHYGPAGACALHKAMAEFTLKECLSIACEVQVHYTGADHDDMTSWLHIFTQNKSRHIQSTLNYIPQTEGDLGDKIFAALDTASSSPINKNTKQKIIIVGSDCPQNRKDNLRHAFELLNTYDCVIGPSTDGGYYLIAFALPVQNSDFLHKKIRPLFQNITWGTHLVFEQSMAKIKENQLNYYLLPILNDVDTPKDVPQKISVIIPTLNEEDNLSKLLSNIPHAFNIELIVSDAGSTDKTSEIAAYYNAKYLNCAKGRSAQILTASQKASGEILFFLHADSILPALWDVHIRNTLNNKDNSLGYFRFGIAEKFWTKNIIEWATNSIRCKYFKLPFGDQGLFVRTSDFKDWNLPQVPILEDVFLVKKAKKYGRLAEVKATLYTSGRRWFKHGFIRTTLMNWCVLLCAKLGMNLHDIKDAYTKGQNPIYHWLRKLFKCRLT